jgi:hypothetical protein
MVVSHETLREWNLKLAAQVASRSSVVAVLQVRPGLVYRRTAQIQRAD